MNEERNHGQGIPLRRYEHREWYEDTATVILWWIACTVLGFVVGAMAGMLV